eukprot:403341350
MSSNIRTNSNYNNQTVFNHKINFSQSEQSSPTNNLKQNLLQIDNSINERGTNYLDLSTLNIHLDTSKKKQSFAAKNIGSWPEQNNNTANNNQVSKDIQTIQQKIQESKPQSLRPAQIETPSTQYRRESIKSQSIQGSINQRDSQVYSQDYSLKVESIYSGSGAVNFRSGLDEEMQEVQALLRQADASINALGKLDQPKQRQQHRHKSFSKRQEHHTCLNEKPQRQPQLLVLFCTAITNEQLQQSEIEFSGSTDIKAQ